MQRTLEDFLRALRAVDIRISPSEAIDAHRAVAAVGYGDRSVFRDALCVTLAKSAEEVELFETCFDGFFARAEFTGGLGERLDHRDLAGKAGPESGMLAAMLLENDAAGLAQAMEAAGVAARAGEIELNAQRGLIARRILDAMGLRALEARIGALRDSGEPGEAMLADLLAQRRRALFAEADRFVERQARLHATQTGRRLREAILARQALTSVEAEDFRAMVVLVRRMAKRLASRYGRKRRQARRGRLDVRKTISRAMVHGGLPFDIVWKSHTLHKPKIAVLCDVSRSVASAAQFLLLFLYSLNEVVERLDAYAFSDRTVCVNDMLKDQTVENAISLILGQIGFRPTDYGASLTDFVDLLGGRLDRRTTVIILGDGRSNFAEPRLDVMRLIGERARAVIWLNPEPETYWGQGDSKMDAYRRFCTVAQSCNTLRRLERVIDDVLRTYLPR